MRIAISATLSVAILVSTSAGPAAAASVPLACAGAKHKEVGGLARCLESARSKMVVSGDAVSYDEAVAKCEGKFSDKWAQAETKATDKGGSCPSVGDEASVLASVHANADCVATALESGDGRCLLCGNGVVEGSEDCDLGVPITATCSDATAGARPVGTVTCAPGCAYDTSGCGEGAMVGGHEWFLAPNQGESCTSACTARGKTVDPATTTYAGSGGTDANCAAVLAGLGHLTAVAGNNIGVGIGCSYVPDELGGGIAGLHGLRDTSPTTANAIFNNTTPRIFRVCACQ